MRAWTSPDVPRVDSGAAEPVRIHDTATGAVRPSDPDGAARMYVCGITPYDATHLGHAATMIAFDLVNRAWRDAGHEVRYVQNVTDVDDPLLERANATGVDWVELAERETDLFREDMEALRVLAPDHYVGAVESIPLITEMIQQLRDRGVVYEVDGDLYFSVHSDPRFGSVSNFTEDEMLAVFGDRGGDPDRPGKKDRLDCLLWQLERPGEPAWDSIHGRGRPGWHVECSAIALHHLGEEFDVQGGGSDLAFPHHEMSASEAQAAFDGLTFARSYVHAGMVGYEGEKMSKSKGNLVLVSRLREADADRQSTTPSRASSTARTRSAPEPSPRSPAAQSSTTARARGASRSSARAARTPRTSSSACSREADGTAVRQAARRFSPAARSASVHSQSVR